MDNTHQYISWLAFAAALVGGFWIFGDPITNFKAFKKARKQGKEDLVAIRQLMLQCGIVPEDRHLKVFTLDRFLGLLWRVPVVCLLPSTIAVMNVTGDKLAIFHIWMTGTFLINLLLEWWIYRLDRNYLGTGDK